MFEHGLTGQKAMIERRTGNKSLARKEQRRKAQAALLSSAAYFDAKHECSHTGRTTDSDKSLYWNLNHVTSSQSRRIHQDKHYNVEIYADMMKVKVSGQKIGRLDCKKFAGGKVHEKLSPTFGGVIGINIKRQGLGQRGKVKGFSREARKRMIEFLAKVRKPGHMMFLTLTYPDHCPHNDNGQWNADFEKFRHRFERAYPNYSAIWRMELIARKSGDYIGVVCPHYHMIVFTGENFDDKSAAENTVDFWAWCSNNWYEIANCEDERHILHGVDCSTVKSRKHAYAYVSKYVAKTTTDGIEAGRRWGRIGKFDTSKSETFVLTDVSVIQLRRIIRKWLKVRKSPYRWKFSRQNSMQGFSVFGLGDVDENGIDRGVFAGYWQVLECSRIHAGEDRQTGWLSGD